MDSRRTAIDPPNVVPATNARKPLRVPFAAAKRTRRETAYSSTLIAIWGQLGVLSRPRGVTPRHSEAHLDLSCPLLECAWTTVELPSLRQCKARPYRHFAIRQLRRNCYMTIGTVKFFNTSKGFGLSRRKAAARTCLCTPRPWKLPVCAR